ncbi:MAG: chemotaxis protein CheA [Deltaproteobacteria bacterium]|nr:chemotaxis protein CheA [Deltaproteobacteria bacterium]
MSDDGYDEDDELIEVFLEESEENLEALSQYFIQLEESPDDVEVMQLIFRAVHSLKGNAAFFGMNAIKELAHDVEDVLDGARKGKLVITPAAIDAILGATDELRAMLGRVRARQPLVENKEHFASLFAALKTCREIKVTEADAFFVVNTMQSIQHLLLAIRTDTEVSKKILDAAEKVEADCNFLSTEQGESPEASSGETASSDSSQDAQEISQDAAVQNTVAANDDEVAASPPTNAVEKSEGTPKKAAKKPQKVMRVPEEKVDAFMSFVGELIITSEAFSHLQKQLREANTNHELLRRFALTLSGFESLSNDLQKSILDIRLVAAESLTRRLPRMVRDLARGLGKNVKVEITGEDTLIDKSILEGLDAPMNHLIRNCVDHGMELPEDRSTAGKDSVGVVSIDAYRNGALVIFKISDDGKGMDLTRLKNKAVETGVVSPEFAPKMTKEQILSLIFESGMSTAKVVSDVSGRGVGMDVVRSSVEALGGTIDVQSTEGEGTIFTLELPSSSTKVVLQTIVVRVASECYCIPIEEVLGIIHHPDSMAHHQSFGEVITIRNIEHRVVRLGHVLDLSRERRPLNEGVHIQVGNEATGRATLFVDEIVGRQQVVVRALPSVDTSDELFSGVAIFGSGDLGMVLSAENILNASTQLSRLPSAKTNVA